MYGVLGNTLDCRNLNKHQYYLLTKQIHNLQLISFPNCNVCLMK
jgi:hypothetical protein